MSPTHENIQLYVKIMYPSHEKHILLRKSLYPSHENIWLYVKNWKWFIRPMKNIDFYVNHISVNIKYPSYENHF